jgi:Putative prokaryotic signal transducing protein
MYQPDFIIFRTFLNHFDAELAKMALEAAGIQCFVRSDDCGGMRPHLWMAGIDLLVHMDDQQRAEEVLGNEETSPNGSTIWLAPTGSDPD